MINNRFTIERKYKPYNNTLYIVKTPAIHIVSDWPAAKFYVLCILYCKDVISIIIIFIIIINIVTVEIRHI